MNEFDALDSILNQLLGPNGCPWDQEQTLISLRSSLLEEMYETLEAIDLNQTDLMKEEFGDLFFNILFLCKVAEKYHYFTVQEVLKALSDKLIRRHPHVFGEVKIETSEEVVKQWAEIKQTEKGYSSQPSIFDNIPKDLPSLAYANKLIKRLQKRSLQMELKEKKETDEEKIGTALWNTVQKAIELKIDPEQALRATIAQFKNNFKQEVDLS